MYVLGINSYHGDASACLIKDSILIAAAEEERFTRIKHWAGFPKLAIAYCLSEAKMRLSDIQHIAINSDPKANLMKKIGFSLKNRASLQFVLDRIKNKRERASVDEDLKKAFPEEVFNGRLHYIEHHTAHLVSAHTVSGFDESVAVSIDGFGDFSSAAWGLCSGDQVQAQHRVYFPHSAGIFYQAMTQFLGFPNYGDEYKVMGLAPYGKPTYVAALMDLISLANDGSFTLNLEYFRHHIEKLNFEWKNDAPIFADLFCQAPLEHLLKLKKREKSDALENQHHDLAHSVQVVYENLFFNVLNAAHKRYGVDQLSLAGGCAMNSVANGKVYQRTPFKKLYVQSAAGDAGGAIGAAYAAAKKLGFSGSKFHMDHAYWGPQYSDEAIESLLTSYTDLDTSCTVEKINDEQALCDKTAKAIAQGLVVGWFQGRMEWGPRALGNRSILGDPRRADMKDILNLKIKRRESFRPFAPSILREHVCDWFETDDDVPFMMQVYQIKSEQQEHIPAVTHVDGSGRLQTVTTKTNARYYRLIQAFYQQTQVPIVLNTSFNENEPVVCSPEQALNTFLRTKMDVLVLGNWLIARN